MDKKQERVHYSVKCEHDWKKLTYPTIFWT